MINAGDYAVPEWIQQQERDPIEALLESLGEFISDGLEDTAQTAKALLQSPLMLHNIMLANITNVGLLQRLCRLQAPMQYLTPYSNNPAATTDSLDNIFRFGHSGNEYVEFLVLQNNSSTVTVFYSFDCDSTKNGNEIYSLTPGSAVEWNRRFRHLHVTSSPGVNYGGQAGLTVGAFIHSVAYANWGVGVQ